MFKCLQFQGKVPSRTVVLVSPFTDEKKAFDYFTSFKLDLKNINNPGTLSQPRTVFLDRNFHLILTQVKPEARDNLDQGGKVYLEAREVKEITFIFDPQVTDNQAINILEGFFSSLYKFDPNLTEFRKSLQTVVVYSNRAFNKKAFYPTYFTALHKWFCEMPYNLRDPEKIVSIFNSLAKEFKVPLEVMDKKALVSRRYAGILAVAGDAPAYVLKSALLTDKSKPKTAFLGKGICFDSGGLQIKPVDGMKHMRYDLAGASLAFFSLLSAKTLELSLNLEVYLGLTANLISQNSYKPGDLIKMRNGLFIQVDHTDAEGRIVLADLLITAQENKCKQLFTLATLTGGVRVGLGILHGGFFSTDDSVAKKLEESGKEVGEYIWRLPIDEIYAKHLRRDDKVLSNIGTISYGSPIVGAMFLKSFVYEKNVTFSHLDIAGVAWHEKKIFAHLGEGATGFGVRLFSNFLSKI
jgi:leucyl aminopeptidase